MIFILAIIGCLGKEFPKTDKSKRFNACYSLYKVKASKDLKQIEKFLDGFADRDRANSYFIAEVLLKCYSSIDGRTAGIIQEKGVTDEVFERYEGLVVVDLEKIKTSDLKATKEHLELYEEIKNIKKGAESEMKVKKGDLDDVVSSNGLVVLAIMLVIIVSGVCIMKYTYRCCRKMRKHKYS